MSAASRRLLVVLMNTGPRNVEELAAPFDYAAVAAAMDHAVDVLCTAAAGKLMFKGIAEKLHVKPGCSGMIGAAATVRSVVDGECRVLTF
jgi:predicted peroxiredoxin